MVRAALAAIVLCCCVGVAQAQRLPPVNAVVNAGYAPNLLPPAGETKFFSAYTEPQKPSEAVACGWNEVSGEGFDEFGTWWDNTLVSFGGEAFQSRGDGRFLGPFFFLASTNSAGVVGTTNSAFQLIEGSPIRGQIGTSYGIYDFKGRETAATNEPEQQLFVTLGISKRSNVLKDDRLSWGIVWDELAAFNWGAFAGDAYLGQMRGLIGWALGTRNEIGFWGAFATTNDDGVRAANQYNLFWRHNYDFGGQTMLWLGGNDVAQGSWLVGSFGEAPLNNSLALYGNFAFSIPGASAGSLGAIEELWAFGAGLTYYFGAKSVRPSVSGRQGLPLLPVANNGTFLPTF